MIEVEYVVVFAELISEEVDGEFVEVEGHVCYHAFVLLLDAFVRGSGGIDGVDVCRVLR